VSTTAELSEGALYYRDLGDEDGRAISVWAMTFGKARVCIGPNDFPTYDGGWCYEDPRLAIASAHAWDGNGDPPDGWHRDVMRGRRRPNGDPKLEHVRW